MKKTFLFLMILCTFLVFAQAAAPQDQTLKIGLFYDSNALPSANLQNNVGSGYQIGSYDSARKFIPRYSVLQQRISMLQDMNFYHSDAKFYLSGAPKGSKVIGAFHLQLSTTYTDHTAARAMAESLKLRGYEAFVAWQGSGFVVRVGHYTNFAAANSAAQTANLGVTAVAMGNRATTITIVDTVTGTILFEFDGTLGILPAGTATITWFKGNKYYGGFEYSRNAGNITVCNIVSMQNYLKGVVPYEMSASWPQEALRAQAMCARTYAYSNLGKHKAFDLCNSSDCQVYRGTGSATENSDRAVDSTNGMYILYNGKPITAVYHSSNGGATEDSENVWGGQHAYLRGVRDPYEDLNTATHGRWSAEYTGEDIQWILNAKGYTIGKIVDVRPVYTKLGNVYSLTFVDETGKTLLIQKSATRSILNSPTLEKYTYSQRFTIQKKGSETPVAPVVKQLYVNLSDYALDLIEGVSVIGQNGKIQSLKTGDTVVVRSANGTSSYNVSAPKPATPPATNDSNVFVVNGTGWGHNVGLSQNGAKGMANKGFTGEQIVRFYYAGVTISNT